MHMYMPHNYNPGFMPTQNLYGGHHAGAFSGLGFGGGHQDFGYGGGDVDPRGYMGFDPGYYDQGAASHGQAREVSEKGGLGFGETALWARLGKDIAAWQGGKVLKTGTHAGAVKAAGVASKAATQNATRMLGPLANKSIGQKMIKGAATRSGKVAAAKTAGKMVGRLVPGVNIAIAGLDTAEAVKIQKDPNAGILKKGLGWLTAGLSWVAATNIPGVSQIAGGASLVSAIARDIAPGSKVSTATVAAGAGRLITR